MAHRVSQQLSERRKGAPIAVAIALLLLSAGSNFVVINSAVTLLETEPYERRKEELLVVELTEPEPPPEPEPEQEEPEPPDPELPEPPPPEKKFELVEPEPPPPEPEPEPEPAPEPEVEQPPQEIEPPDLNMKMVEQLDEFDDNQTNEDADYLSNIDRKVAEQTRAEITNLSQDAREAQASQVEPSNNPERGTAAEDDIHQTETQRSAVARQAPDVRPEKVDQRPEQKDPVEESLLATRELAEREHSEAMEAEEDMAIEAEDGVVEVAQLESASVLPQDHQARVMRRDPRYQFKLSQHEMDALFGEDRNAPKNVESLELSKNEGMWDDARKAYQSPLENMVSEVKVGNQTALNSRKHPFARYIATMHRGIHEAWAFGYLEALERHPASHPLNNLELWTKVEIVLNADGTVDKVRTVHASGNSSFDAAAREVVMSEGPYPSPPKEIRSGNGKIYMHWAFHRNEYACGTFGAQPFILDNAGAGDVPDAHAMVHPGHGHGAESEQVRSLSRNDGSSAAGSTGPIPELHRGGEGPGMSAAPEGPTPPPNKSAASGSGAAKLPPPTGPVVAPGGRGTGGFGGGGSGVPGSGVPGAAGAPGSGGGSGSGSGGAGTGTGTGGGSKPGSMSLSGSRSAASPNTPPPSATTQTPTTQTPGESESESESESEGVVDPVASAVAKNWARAFASGEVTTMVNRSAVPFHSGSKIAAKSKEDLERLLRAMSEEVAGHPAKVQGSYTAAGLRKKFGSVPDGVEEGKDRVYTVVEIGGDTVILVLEKRFGSWRVIGVTR